MLTPTGAVGVGLSCSMSQLRDESTHLRWGTTELAAHDAREVRLVREAIFGGEQAQAGGAVLQVGEDGADPQAIAVRRKRFTRDETEDPAEVVGRAADEAGELLEPHRQPTLDERFSGAIDEAPVREDGFGPPSLFDARFTAGGRSAEEVQQPLGGLEMIQASPAGREQAAMLEIELVVQT